MEEPTRTEKFYFNVEELTKPQIRMIFQLLASDQVFMCGGGGGFCHDPEEDLLTENFSVMVLCSDYFAPAADCEECGLDELKSLYEYVKEYDDITGWVAKRRGVPDEHWRDRWKREQKNIENIKESVKPQNIWQKIKRAFRR